MSWIESSGATAATWNQPNVDLWSAPYTNSPTQLASTATKLVTLPVRSVTPSNAIAFRSLYAVAPLPFDVAYIVSLADGSIRRVSAGPNWKFATLVLVTSTELWAVLDAVNGQSGVALAKYSL